MVQAECLPTEIWLKIFSYLDPTENIRAFSNLNRFFDRFASTKYFLVHHRLTKDDCKSNLSNSLTQSLRLETIGSLTVGRRQRNHCMDFFRMYSDRLINLQKLSIYFRQDIVTNLMHLLIDALKRLPSLKALEVHSHGEGPAHWGPFGYLRIEDFLRTVLSDQLSLTHCQLLFTLSNFGVPSNRWSGVSSIRYLTLTTISWSNLVTIFHRIPDLRTITASISSYQSESLTLIFPSLRKIKLTVDRTPFALLTEMCRLAPRLDSLTVFGWFTFTDENYFLEDSWRKLLDPISTYFIWIDKPPREQNDVEQLRRVANALKGKPWFELKDNPFGLHGRITFRKT